MTTAVLAIPDLLGTSPADLLPDPRTDYDSGEPVTAVVLADEGTAQARADRIRTGLPTYLEVRALLAEAYAEEDWRALGHESWGAYLLAEFSGVALPREHKREAIKASIVERPELSDRQHAARIGASHPTVASIRKDLEKTGDVERTSTRSDKSGRAQPATKAAPSQVDAEPERVTVDRTVWISTWRKGIDYHDIDHDDDSRTGSTLCGRPMGHGQHVDRGEVLPEGAQLCKRCEATAAARAEWAADANREAAAAAERERAEEDGRRRTSKQFGEAITTLTALLVENHDVAGFVGRRYRHEGNPSRLVTPEAFTPAGLRAIAHELLSLAEHLESEGIML